MPTYEYICDACGNEFENFASMSAPPIKKCPKCGKNKVQRKISVGGGIIFKGGGFYETDYRSDAYRKSAEADKPQSDSSESPASDKPVETKAETKVDAKPAESAKATSGSETSAKAETPTKSAEPKTPPAPAVDAKSSSSKTRKR